MIDHNQAYLIYSMFHKIRTEDFTKLLSRRKEVYVFNGIVPVTGTISWVFIALLCLTLYLVVSKHVGDPSIKGSMETASLCVSKVGLCMFFFNVTRYLDLLSQVTLATTSFIILCYSFYSILNWVAYYLSKLSESNSTYYDFKVLSSSYEKKED